MNAPTQRQSGFAIVTAVFLIILVATVGMFVFSISHREGVVPDRTLLSSRAHVANRSGLEWALQQAIGPSPQGGNDGLTGNCAPSTAFTMSGFGLNGVTVAVTCSVQVNPGQANWENTYYLTATVTVGTFGTVDYVERKLEGVVCRSSDQSGASVGTEC